MAARKNAKRARPEDHDQRLRHEHGQEADEEAEGARSGARLGTRLASGAAVSLTVLEVKRLILLTIEILVNSRAIRFAGVLLPVLVSFVDVGLGFPIAIAAVHAIRRQYRRGRSAADTKRCNVVLGRISVLLALCAVLNALTLALIWLRVNLEPGAMREIFSVSMGLYSSNATQKMAMDELQLDLQCCGFGGYDDWFRVDWQGLAMSDGDYEDGKEAAMAMQDKSVPFSCCDRRSPVPCGHSPMRKGDESTVNVQGCAATLHQILLKISIVGYIMTGVILVTQLFLVVLMIKVVRRAVPPGVRGAKSACSCYEPSLPLINHNYSSDDDCATDCPMRVVRMDRAVETDEHHQKIYDKAAVDRAQKRMATLLCAEESCRFKALFVDPRRVPDVLYSDDPRSECNSRCSYGTTWSSTEGGTTTSPGISSSPGPPPPSLAKKPLKPIITTPLKK